MHDAGVVIGNVVIIDEAGAKLLKIIIHASWNVLSQNVHVTVSIRTCLLMLKADCVSQFVNDNFFLKWKEVKNENR